MTTSIKRLFGLGKNMSKDKKIKDTQKPSLSEFVGRKLVDRAIHKKSKGQTPSEHDHNHDHNHDHFYIAMIIDNKVEEVVTVGENVANLLLAQPKMVHINEKDYEVRPTIGWQYIDDKFVAPEEPK